MKNRQLDEIQREIDLVAKRMLNNKAHRMNDKSKTKLIAASVLLFVFVVTVSLFGG